MYDDEMSETEPDTEAAVRPVTRRRLWLPFALNVVTFGVMCMALAAAGGVSYLALSNHLITQGFALNETKERLSALTRQNRELELAVMQEESSAQVTERVAGLGMVDAGEITYIEVRSNEVAMR